MREADIKRALTQHLEAGAPHVAFHILEEVGLNGGEVRADLVQVMEMHCYEIKSEVDSLKRLIGQGARYARAFDLVTLVTAKKHLKSAMLMLPTWWGIMLIPNHRDEPFTEIREAKLNHRHQPDVLASLLNREEALRLLEEQGIMRGYKSKSLYILQNKVAELIPLAELKEKIRVSLLARSTRDTALSQHTQYDGSSFQ